MKKYLPVILLLILLLGGLIYFIRRPKESEKPNNSEKNPEEEIQKQVAELLSQMSLDEKIAQMLIITTNDTSLSPDLQETLTTYHPGGFILFANNFTDYASTRNFVQDMQNTATIPMFISIDQEGGLVQRMKSLTGTTVSDIPSMALLGQTNDPALASQVGKVIAEELRTIGVNLDFAPVIDVISNPNNTVIGSRSFGTDKDVVASMGTALAQGLLDNGVIPVYKHFPGHGSTSKDSHYDLPVITKSKEELLNSDLVPFKKAIASNAQVIMIGHLAVPSLTIDNTPASLSKALITDFLKNELNYQGLVITDALNMQALTLNYSEEEIYTYAINAGVDILLMPTSCSSAVAKIKEAIQKGNLTEEQIDNSVRHILTTKLTYLTDYQSLPNSYLNSPEHQEIIKQIPQN